MAKIRPAVLLGFAAAATQAILGVIATAIAIRPKIWKRNSGVGSGNGPRRNPARRPVFDRFSEWWRDGDETMRCKIGLNRRQFAYVYSKCRERFLSKRRVRSRAAAPKNSKRGRKAKMSPVLMLCMLLYWMRCAPSVDQLGKDFGINYAGETLKHALQQFVLAMKSEVAFPTLDEQAEMRDATPFPPFEGAFLIVDGTYFRITRKRGNYTKYRGCWHRNAQVVVDSNLKIVFVAAGFAGTVSDRDQLLQSKVLDKVIGGGRVLADGGYSSLPGVIAAGSQAAKDNVDVFTKWRTRVEHVFARLKGNFDILVRRFSCQRDMDMQAQAVQACCMMYNLLLRAGHFRAY